MQKYQTKFIQLTLWLAFATTFISGQKTSAPQEIIQIETNAVFIEALVRDKSTGEPITNLRREDFTLKVDNKPREISEFSFDGKTNCPLTIILFFNLAPNGALKYLDQPKAQQSMSKTLATLQENDEVAVLTIRDWFVGKPQLILKPTRNWEEVSKSVAGATVEAVHHQSHQPKSDRINKSTMSDAIELVETLSKEHSEREFALVYISDGVNTLDTLDFANRKLLGNLLLKHNLSFSALNFDLMASYKIAADLINPIAFVFGSSVTGSPNYLAKETGGVSVNVSQAEDFGAALEKIIKLYGSRYSLGFYLGENETIDTKLHKLEVKLRNNRQNQIIVSARRGFYLKKQVN